VKGYVYLDGNNDGFKQSGEAGIGGRNSHAHGMDDLGNAISISLTTGADGSYGSRAATRDVQDHGDAAGRLPGRQGHDRHPGGATLNDQFTNVVLAPRDRHGQRFGELLHRVCPVASTWTRTATAATMSASHPSGVTVTLTATTTSATAINLIRVTGLDGKFSFTVCVRATSPSRNQPAGFLQGTNTIGSLGGAQANDQFFIAVGSGAVGVGYKFGEVLPLLPPPPPPHHAAASAPHHHRRLRLRHRSSCLPSPAQDLSEVPVPGSLPALNRLLARIAPESRVGSENMSQPPENAGKEQRLLRHARREGLVILIVWALALFWSVGSAYVLGTAGTCRTCA